MFVQCTYPQVSSSYVCSFGSYRVDEQTNTPTNPQTNKQMPLKTSNILRYASTLGKYSKLQPGEFSGDSLASMISSSTTVHVGDHIHVQVFAYLYLLACICKGSGVVSLLAIGHKMYTKPWLSLLCYLGQVFLFIFCVVDISSILFLCFLIVLQIVLK